MADHPSLARIAADAGVRRQHFPDEDISIIYGAAVAGRDKERRYVLRDAMFALIDAGYWDTTQIPENLGQLLWSCESLVVFSRSCFPSPSNVTYFARRVVELAERANGARMAYETCVGMLDGSATPDGASNWQIARAA